MPSIEILDISRNKIRKLPTSPGTLINLKVRLLLVSSCSRVQDSSLSHHPTVRRSSPSPRTVSSVSQSGSPQ